jgi:hypothetical protein
MGGQPLFLDCPAYLGDDGDARCGLPAEVEVRCTTRSTGGPLESAKSGALVPLVQRAHRIPHRAGAAGRGRGIRQPAGTSDRSKRSTRINEERQENAMTPLMRQCGAGSGRRAH